MITERGLCLVRASGAFVYQPGPTQHRTWTGTSGLHFGKSGRKNRVLPSHWLSRYYSLGIGHQPPFVVAAGDCLGMVGGWDDIGVLARKELWEKQETKDGTNGRARAFLDDMMEGQKEEMGIGEPARATV